MQIAIEVNEGVTILLSEKKIEQLVKEKYQEAPTIEFTSEELKPIKARHDWKDGTNKCRWTEAEDQQIIKFLDGYGSSMTNYQILAGRLGRTFEATKTRVSVLRARLQFRKKGMNEPERSVEPSQLKFQKVNKKRSHKRWKASEDKKLEHFITKYGNNKDSRKQIAEILRRSAHSIQIRLLVLKKKLGNIDYSKKLLVFTSNGSNQAKTLKLKKWTKTEEEVVRKEVLAGGRTSFNYKRIAKLINRTPASIQQKESKLRRKRKGLGKNER